MDRSRRVLAVLLLSVAASACGGTTKDSGGGSGGSGGAIEPGPFTGEWKGYAENYAFDDGSDAVTLNLDAVQAQVSGRITFGTSALLPPPTDPDVGYPPNFSSTGEMGIQKLWAGFAYSLRSGSFDGQRLKFSIATGELWAEWCALQTPIADETNSGSYTCLPNWGGTWQEGHCSQTNPETQETIDVDCGKLALCNGPMVCECAASGCTARVNDNVSFDMLLEPPKADGSASGLDASVHNVRLTKQ